MSEKEKDPGQTDADDILEAVDDDESDDFLKKTDPALPSVPDTPNPSAS